MSARGVRLGVALAALSAGFAVVHALWALGWRAGVPADAPPIAQRPVFLTYDVVAGLLMIGASAVALLLVTDRGRRWMVVATLVASVGALLRGVPALAIDVATGQLGFSLSPVVDVWFTAVGVLGLALWREIRPLGRR